jgi:2-polyprenyl-3-methyl-5-hydroxy-6-metoxy-1,4-benzoquinol methylase
MTTIIEHCCGADMFFDKKKATKEYRKYLKKGPTKATAKIIQQLEGQDLANKTLIDVGGGIGALQWWFLQQGGKHTTDIDASSGYLKQAQNHAATKGWHNNTNFVLGDCTEIYTELPDPDYITLDKVVCCYPNFEEILTVTCDKSQAYVALSYPMDGIIAQVIRNIGTLFFMLKRNPFRPFVHPVKEIRDIFAQKGYTRVAHNLAFPWHVETYAKSV